MTDLCYSFRENAFSTERTFRIGLDALYWETGSAADCIPFRDVGEVRYCRGFATSEVALKGRTLIRLQLRCRFGRKLTLSPLHYVHFRSWEDRSATYLPFVDTLLNRLRENPHLKIVTVVQWPLRLRHSITRGLLPSLISRFGEMLVKLVGWFGLDRTAAFSSRLMRTVGPWSRAHRVAHANLMLAFPQKSESEVQDLLQGVWDNFGRVMAEYAFTNELFDYNPLSLVQERIFIDQTTVDRLFALRDESRPVLFFGAHTGNWELAALAAAFGIPLAVLYRPFKSERVNELIIKSRGQVNLIAARRGAARQVETCLQRGSSIGMLVDQHFSGGADVHFFGRKCKANPTLAKLARKYELPVFGVRFIRQPQSRFIVELTEQVKPARDHQGKIHIADTTQAITDVVEGWIREYPEQWLWLHRRWRLPDPYIQ